METRKEKIIKILFRLYIAVIALLLIFRQFYIAGIVAIPLMIFLFKITVKGMWYFFSTPFRFLHKLFTKKLSYGSDYKNNFERIVFGWFGNIAYIIFLFFMFSFLLTYRPYQDGYILKNNTYNVDRAVIVEFESKERAMGIVKETPDIHDKESAIKVSINGKTIDTDKYNLTKAPIIRGYYITENENFFIQVAKSGLGWIKYIISAFLK